MPPKKKKQRVKYQSLHDEILFANDETLFKRHGVDLSILRNVYTRGCDRGSDRLYFSADSRLYAHVNPHVYAWHSNVPSEVIYGSLASKYGIHSSVERWWLTTTSEIVVIYSKNGTSLLLPSSALAVPTATVVDAAAKFFFRCKSALVEAAIFPTAFNPKRIYYSPESNEFGFYESGHFQNSVWYANESCRIVDVTYGHPTLEQYFPVNAFKTRADVMSESLVSGLLNFYHGTVAFFYFCLVGSDPVRNSKKRRLPEGRPRCSNPLGVCESVMEEKYRLFFDEYYCVQALRVLPMLLRKRAESQELVTEFVARYDALLDAIGRLL
jgi:hypothetical protein